MSSTDPIAFKQGNGAKAGSIGAAHELSPTLASVESGTNQVPAVMCANPWDSQRERIYHGDGAWHSLNANNSGGQSRDAVLTYGFDGNKGSGARGLGYEQEKAMTTTTSGGGIASFAVDCRNGTESPDVNGTLQAKENGGFTLNCNIVIREIKSWF